jgi:hypothetical protein
MSKDQTHKPSAALVPAGFDIPHSARCMLVYRDDAGMLVSAPVEHGKSVLNIERDLLIHLNEKPYSTEWLQVLRDYCDSRIEARKAARAGGAIVTPSPSFNWDMTVIAGKAGGA